ncbi:MAG: hypothetical protein LUG83_09840 [Lachnospiraceae bacterium]|nr:hypothetical protein [Lachnospiraceae bacterium]
MNAVCEKNESIIEDYRKKFESMLDYAQKILGDRGFRKTKTSKSTPRARFEALAVGIGLALADNPDLPVRDVSDWIDGEEFAECTRSDAANNKSKLVARVEFVKNKLLQVEK